MDQIVAVTGATGYVGRFVVDELQRQGVHIRALARPRSARAGYAAPIEWVEGDLRSATALRRLVDGASSVVHLAYEHVPGRYRGGEGQDLDSWLSANLMGSLQLLSQAVHSGAARFVFLSSRAVFSRTEPGRLLDESHPVSPDSHYGAYKAAVEAFLRSFRTQNGLRTFAVRATGVYGLARPVEQSKWWDLVVQAVDGAADAGFVAERGGTEVYGGDVARVVWALLSRPEIAHDIYHLSDLYVTHNDVIRIARRFIHHASEPRGACASADLQATPIAPANPLECRNLRALGIRLGGVAALEKTIEELVLAARARQRNSRTHKGK